MTRHGAATKTYSSSVLVALLREKRDLTILLEEGWYRIPVDSAPRRWPPKHLAFYQPSCFGREAFQIRLYGAVTNIVTAGRGELFPNEPPNANSSKQYFKLMVECLEQRAEPIVSRFPRRVVFIPTTMPKFLAARELNDLYDESPLEDRLWEALKKAEIPAERQFELPVADRYFQLDFAIFCNEGQIDAETDGDSYHARREQIPKDNVRNNALAAAGWQVLRYNGTQVSENKAKYCVDEIKATVNRLGGLRADGLVPRKFFPDDDTLQLSLF